MAVEPKGTRARDAEAARTGETVDRAISESQRLMRAWVAASSASLQGWSDFLRVSADTATKAAKAFDDEMK